VDRVGTTLVTSDVRDRLVSILSRWEDVLAIEYLLAHGLPFVTFNYFIGPDYLARRETLLRPAPGTPSKSEPVIAEKFRNRVGLTARHRDALRAVAEAA
jgi:hypothetical protein